MEGTAMQFEACGLLTVGEQLRVKEFFDIPSSSATDRQFDRESHRFLLSKIFFTWSKQG